MARINKIFDVYIYDKPRPVYSIEGKEHQGYNDTPKTWWLYNGEELPEGLLPPEDSEYLVPYCCRSIERRVWSISFKQRTYTKVKWDETSYRNSTTVEIICNTKTVLTFTTTGGEKGMSYAMAKAQYLMTVMAEHPYNFFDQESERGRKIFFYGMPATIRPSSYPGEVHIIPEYSDKLDKKAWWKEYRRRKTDIDKKPDEWDDIEKESDSENEFDDLINWGSALEDGRINWFRN